MESITAAPIAGPESKVEQPSAAAQASARMKILVAIDDSEAGFYALRWVLDNFFTTQPLMFMYELTILHVIEPFPNYVFPGAPGVYPTASLVQSVNTVQQENATVTLRRAMQICEEKKVEAKSSILVGIAKETICEAADRMQIELIVVGSRGLGMIKRAFLGSVSDYVAHHTRCATLIVKPPKKSEK